MEYNRGEKRCPGKPVDFQGSPPPKSRMVHPEKKKIKQRWHKACMDEQGAPENAQI